MYTAAKLVDIMRNCADSTIGEKKTSKIVFGTVQTINPLSILLDGHEKPIHESFFYLSRNVKVCEESLRIRAIKGKFEGLDLNITAETFVKMLKGHSIKNDVRSQEGKWQVSIEDPADGIGVEGEIYSRTESLQDGTQNLDIAQGELQTNIQNAELKIKINEEPYLDETHRDHRRHTRVETNEIWEGKLKTSIHLTDKDEMDTAFYDQTLVIDVIRNRGLKVGDFVLCTSHNNQQLYIVWEVLNRLL